MVAQNLNSIKLLRPIWNRNINGKFSQKWIKFTAGVVIGFNQIIDALAKPGDSVLIQTPAYPPILNAASNRKISCCQVPLSCSSSKYEIDFDKFEESILPGTKFFILCNPQNPSGRFLRDLNLKKLQQSV